MRTGYGAEMGLVDFVNQAEAARGEINGWVRKQTADKITDLIPPGVLGPDTRLVLANAIYFRGDWARQFEKSATQDQPFHVTGDRTVTAPLMFGKIRAGYAARADGALKVLELPYKGDEVSMLVLLPDAPDGLPALEAGLTADTYRAWTTDLARRDVLVYLPRFSVESRFALAPTLGAMGMPLAFTDRADFSGMDGKRDLFISAVVHKARVDVDERGTEAAAATGVGVGTDCGATRSRPRSAPTIRSSSSSVTIRQGRFSSSVAWSIRRPEAAQSTPRPLLAQNGKTCQRSGCQTAAAEGEPRRGTQGMRKEADRIEVDPHHGGDGVTQARAPRFGILLLAMLAELTLTPFVIMATGTLMIARLLAPSCSWPRCRSRDRIAWPSSCSPGH